MDAISRQLLQTALEEAIDLTLQEADPKRDAHLVTILALARRVDPSLVEDLANIEVPGVEYLDHAVLRRLYIYTAKGPQ